MPDIDISELIYDPDFAQENGFIVHRRFGEVVNYRFVPTDEILPVQGIILPMKTKDIKRLPEGDRIEGAINVWSTIQLFTTLQKPNEWTKGRVSDQVEWKGLLWVIQFDSDYSDFGYYKTQAVRMKGA